MCLLYVVCSIYQIIEPLAVEFMDNKGSELKVNISRKSGSYRLASSCFSCMHMHCR